MNGGRYRTRTCDIHGVNVFTLNLLSFNALQYIPLLLKMPLGACFRSFVSQIRQNCITLLPT